MNEKMKGIVTVFVDIDDTLWWFTENSKLALRHTFDAFDISSVPGTQEKCFGYVLSFPALYHR